MGKEEVNLSLFADGLIICVGNLTESSTIKLLELISEFSRIADYKINIKTQLFFCTLVTNNQESKFH